MKNLLIMFAAAATLIMPTTHAQTAQGQTPQQSKMASCNKEAGDMKGDTRKAFMKNCLSAKPADGRKTQQEKMKTCNKEAGAMKGDERKAYMKECLRKS